MTAVYESALMTLFALPVLRFFAMPSSVEPPVGGGFKKVLYTLQTLRRIGLKQSSKALASKNACKACGLGMGGQQGGMTNELGEFPSVCNKSVQAQSTDIQPPIPDEIFEHSLSDLAELSGREIESLGRLTRPLFKSAGAEKFEPIGWSQALDLAVNAMTRARPDKSFFYASGRSSNEAGFVLQLFARLFGTNNVNNCSYYCHQASGVGLTNSIGSGTATIEVEDLHGCDLIFLIGANPASNHPRLIHKLKQCRERGGQIVVINPAKEPGLVRFAVPKSPSSLILGGSDIASEYLQPKIASDELLLKAIAKAVLAFGAENKRFIDQHTEGFEAYLADVMALEWSEVERGTGISRSEIERIASLYNQSEHTVFAWGMGITHHLHGVENVEAIANLALLRGMVGKRFAGLLPLRGHSNVQGVGTIGVKPVLAKEVIEAIEQQVGVSMPNTPGMDTLACLEAAASGRIDVGLFMGGNLYEATPDSNWAQASLQSIPFKIFLTTTLNRGHVFSTGSEMDDETLILPVLARDEEPQPTTQESMFNYVRLSDGGIDRLDGPRSEVDVLVNLASRVIKATRPEVAAAFDMRQLASHDNIRSAIATAVPGMAALKDIAVAKREFHVQNRLLHTPVFHTETGKARFCLHPSGLTEQGSSVSSGSPFPFMLATVRSEGQFNSIVYEERDSYRGADHRWVLFMGPDDMEELGLMQGSRVTLASEVGRMADLEVRRFDLPSGSLMAYYPEANCLTGRSRDPRSQTPNFKSVPVAVSQ